MSTWNERIACGVLVSKIYGHYAFLLTEFEASLLNPIRTEDVAFAVGIVASAKKIYNQVCDLIGIKHKLWNSGDVPAKETKRIGQLRLLLERHQTQIIDALESNLSTATSGAYDQRKFNSA